MYPEMWVDVNDYRWTLAAGFRLVSGSHSISAGFY